MKSNFILSTITSAMLIAPNAFAMNQNEFNTHPAGIHRCIETLQINSFEQLQCLPAFIGPTKAKFTSRYISRSEIIRCLNDSRLRFVIDIDLTSVELDQKKKKEIQNFSPSFFSGDSRHLRFFQDGLKMLRQTDDNSLHVMNTDTLYERRLEFIDQPFIAASISSNGKRLVTLVPAPSESRHWYIENGILAPQSLYQQLPFVARLWNTKTRKPYKFDLATDSLPRLSSDGSRVAVGVPGGWNVIDVKSGQVILNLNFRGTKQGDFSPDDSKFISVNTRGDVRMWDSHTGQELFTKTVEENPLYSFSLDNRKVLIGKDVFAVNTGQKLFDSTKEMHPHPVKETHLSTDGSKVFVLYTPYDTRSVVAVLDIATKRRRILSVSIPHKVDSVEISPDQTKVVASYLSGVMGQRRTAFYDMNTGKKLFSDKFQFIKFFPDSKKFIGYKDKDSRFPQVFYIDGIFRQKMAKLVKQETLLRKLTN
ncbi:MAG: hypothetical protein ABIQ95_05600 [Bdellovibrionia bacterium]